MQLILIFGPTCSGKTDIAVKLAEDTGWPVIALDRVQCCPQIASGSGRPLARELRATKRLYLDSRPLREGIIDAESAHLRLTMEVDGHRNEPGLILEGGSISLLNYMARSQFWTSGFRWNVKRLRLGDPDAFLQRAKERVQQMFVATDERPSLLQELVALWEEKDVRHILQDVDGYRYAIRFAKQHGLPIDELLHLHSDRRQDLIDGIAHEYLEHAHWQERDFPKWDETNLTSPFQVKTFPATVPGSRDAS
ncbi:isopentenyl transferase (plasmid) [Agrobacterium tumefaciens]|uniref:Adenylate dimethylallyltransferase n=1 Tax=Agrobacterium tumefaciens TaxID=358 RepID=A0AAJ4N974_AGRTU|nr:isopentenyl transferase [Agrobacterium tumefaciens]